MNEIPRENIRERRLENFWKKLEAFKVKKSLKSSSLLKREKQI
jgi:hypothetical protein